MYGSIQFATSLMVHIATPSVSDECLCSGCDYWRDVETGALVNIYESCVSFDNKIVTYLYRVCVYTDNKIVTYIYQICVYL